MKKTANKTVAVKPVAQPLTVAEYIAVQNPALLTIAPVIESFPLPIANPVDVPTTNYSEYKTKIKALDKSKVPREANKLRARFIELLGLPAATSKTDSYKGQETADMQILESVIEVRNQYEIICNVTGRYYNILEKMDRNLRNSDRASLFAALERKAKKAALNETSGSDD